MTSEAGEHKDLAVEQSLYKALEILKIFNCKDTESSWAKPSLQPVNLPGETSDYLPNAQLRNKVCMRDILLQ